MRNDSLYYAASAAALSLALLLTPATTHAAKGRNFNININGGDAETCAGLKVSTNGGGQIAQVNESFTLRKSEAPLLELNAVDHGHITVRGWDRGEYSVETCKIAAAETSSAADQTVRG